MINQVFKHNKTTAIGIFFPEYLDTNIHLLEIIGIASVIILMMNASGDGNGGHFNIPNNFNYDFNNNNDDKKNFFIVIIISVVALATSAYLLGYITGTIEHAQNDLLRSRQQQFSHLLFMEQNKKFIEGGQLMLFLLDLPDFLTNNVELENLIKTYNNIIVENNQIVSNIAYQYIGIDYHKNVPTINHYLPEYQSYIKTYSFSTRTDFENTINNLIKARNLKSNLNLPLISML